MGGSVECSPCPAGWLCLEGLGVPCGYGTHSNLITTAIQEDKGSSSRAPDGVYGGTCSECPAGSACPGAGLREECSTGTFSPGGMASTTCIPCPPGTFTNGTANVKCEDCAAGENYYHLVKELAGVPYHASPATPYRALPRD